MKVIVIIQLTAFHQIFLWGRAQRLLKPLPSMERHLPPSHRSWASSLSSYSMILAAPLLRKLTVHILMFS